MLDGCGQEATSSAGWVQHYFVGIESRVDAINHEIGDGAWGVELAGIARATQVVEQLFVDIAKLLLLFEFFEMDCAFQFLDDGEELDTRLHVVVGIFKDAADRRLSSPLAGIQIFECGEKVIVYERNELSTRFLALRCSI